MAIPSQPTTALLLSGGVDSAVLLHQLLLRGWRVVPVYVRTGCVWEDAELAAIRQFLAALDASGVEELVQFEMLLSDLHGDHWSMTGADVPNDATPDEAVYLPGRNSLLLLKPMLWCARGGIQHVAMATLANNPFDDATPEFFARFESMCQLAGASNVSIARPFERLTKAKIMEMGRNLPLELTFSCLAPIDGRHCGSCNKCAERRAAFQQAGIHDATPYVHAAPSR